MSFLKNVQVIFKQKMHICGKCLTMLYKERKPRETANGAASLSKRPKKILKATEQNDTLDNLINIVVMKMMKNIAFFV